MSTEDEVPSAWRRLPPMDALWPYEMPAYEIRILGDLPVDHTFTVQWPEWLSQPDWGPGIGGSLMLPEDYVPAPIGGRSWTWNASAVAEPPYRIGLSFVTDGEKIQSPFEVRLTMIRATRIYVDGLRWSPPSWDDGWYRYPR